MTIIDLKSGKALPWTALQTAAYSLLDAPVGFEPEGHRYDNGYESVTGILKAEGIIDDRFFTEESRDRGSYVHLAVKYDHTGELDEESLDPVIVPYLQAWRTFKAQSSFVVESFETPMVASTYKYNGMPDVTGKFPAGANISRAAVELHDDGTYKLIPYKDRQDVNIWLSVLAAHNWKKNNLRR